MVASVVPNIHRCILLLVSTFSKLVQRHTLALSFNGSLLDSHCIEIDKILFIHNKNDRNLTK